jgi:electron transfer flavoprotein beta subunit
MRIIVCIKEVVDSNLNLGYGQVDEELRQKGLALRLNPNDAEALAEALILKEREKDAQVEITVISISPEGVECYLRDGLALGADRAVRIWGEDLKELSPYQKAKVLSKAISLFNADLILTGAKSMDNATGQVGPLIAAWLDLPCVCEVVGFQLEGDRKSITVLRNTDRGVQERVLSTLPAVLTVEGQGRKLPYASLDKILESKYAQVTLLSLSDLGISSAELANDPTKVVGLSFPRPRPKKIPTPESSSPAFNRILMLLQGGILKRRGKMLAGNSDELADQLFELLIEEDIIRLTAEQGIVSQRRKGKV